MIIREITASDREVFNQKAGHPLQSFEWGEFRAATGVKVVRKGIFEDKKLITPIQVTIHPVPKTKFKIGYFPKGPMPDEVQLEVLKQIGTENQCIMVKMEPNVGAVVNTIELKTNAWGEIDGFLSSRGCRPGRPLFTRNTFQLDLSKKEDELLAKMHPKTRYNIRLAEKRGIKVKIDNSEANFQWFLKLLFEETVVRQGFYAHSKKYFETMWQKLEPAKLAYLIRAEYDGKPLAVFMALVFNGKIYYPYGASTRDYKELMAPNLLMWEMIKFGKQKGCVMLDMWGALGPDANTKDPWYGFHRFKQGYGGDLIEFLGTYDLVINQQMYPFYKLADQARWAGLKTKAKIKKLPFETVNWVRTAKKSALSLFE